MSVWQRLILYYYFRAKYIYIYSYIWIIFFIFYFNYGYADERLYVQLSHLSRQCAKNRFDKCLNLIYYINIINTQYNMYIDIQLNILFCWFQPKFLGTVLNCILPINFIIIHLWHYGYSAVFWFGQHLHRLITVASK